MAKGTHFIESVLLQMNCVVLFLLASVLTRLLATVAMTRSDTVLCQRYYKAIGKADWLACLEACSSDSDCVSYNFKPPEGPCELNKCGAESRCEDTTLFVYGRGFAFHQLRQFEASEEIKCKFKCTSGNQNTVFPEPTALYPLSQDYPVSDESAFKNPSATRENVGFARSPFGKDEGASSFRGEKDSYIEIPRSGGTEAKKSMTIAIWVYPERAGLIVMYYDLPILGVSLWVVKKLRHTKLLVDFSGNRNSSKRGELKLSMKPSYWNYICAVYNYDAGTATLWVNNEKREVPIGSFELDTGHNLRMGAWSSRHFSFRGRLSCFQVYDRALSAKEASKIKYRCRDLYPASS